MKSRIHSIASKYLYSRIYKIDLMTFFFSRHKYNDGMVAIVVFLTKKTKINYCIIYTHMNVTNGFQERNYDRLRER